MKSHIFDLIAAQRRLQGLSQQDLADLAGLRREKINRIENRHEDVGFGDLLDILDALGLEMSLRPKAAPGASAAVAAEPANAYELAPKSPDEASLFDWSGAQLVSRGKIY